MAGGGRAVLPQVASATEGARTSVCPSPLLTNAHRPLYTCVLAWDTVVAERFGARHSQNFFRAEMCVRRAGRRLFVHSDGHF